MKIRLFLFFFKYPILVICLYYVAKLKNKEKLFQKAYQFEDECVYITNTEKCKKKFLKSGKKNVIFKEEFYDDLFFSNLLCEAWAYDEVFCLGYVENMVKEISQRLKLTLPLEEIAVCTQKGEMLTSLLSGYTKLITLCFEKGEGYFENGVPVRQVKKLKTTPDLIIYIAKSPPLFDIPTIDLREIPKRGSKTLTWDRLSFKTDLFNFEINTPALLYFLKKGEIKNFELTSLRKKCTRIFTFS